MSTINNKGKINWVLILQAWAMLWVVIGHAILGAPNTTENPGYVNVLFNIAYSFHMPLFIFVSGYLFFLTKIDKQVTYGKMILDKLRRLGIPFIFFTIVALILKDFMGNEMARPTTISFKSFINAILYPNEGPMREFWFIAVIMWMFVMKPIWMFFLKNRNTQIIGLIIFTFLAVFYSRLGINTELLCLGRTFQFAIYFYAGLLFRKLKLEEYITQGWKLLILSLFLFILLFVIDIKIPLILPMSGILSSISLSIILEQKYPSIFKFFRDYTYQIYLMGIFFQITIQIVYRKLSIVDVNGGGICSYTSFV